MNRLVSIVVPVYNVENYLKRCVESIVNQTYKNTEIILVDDGATDNSGELCDKLAKTDSRIKVIHKSNGGLSDARNKGIDIALGDWIMFVDSDDLIAPDMVEKLIKTAEKSDAQIAICDPVHVFEDKPENILFEKENAIVTYIPIEAIKEMWYQHSFLPSAWGKLYKRDLFASIRFTKGILFEDIDIMHELFILTDKIVYTNAKLYAYMHRENSITTQKFSEREFDILNICDKLIDFSKEYSDDVKKAALAYSVVGNMRIFVSAPKNGKYESQRKKCECYISEVGRTVLKDKNLRKKTRIGLIMFFFNKRLFVYVRSKINRWK